MLAHFLAGCVVPFSLEQCADGPRMCPCLTDLWVGRPDLQYQSHFLRAMWPVPSYTDILNFSFLLGKICLRSAFGPHRYQRGFTKIMTSSHCCQLCISGPINGRSCPSSLWKCEQICLSSDEVQEWIWLDGYGSISQSLHGNYSERENEHLDQISESLDFGSIWSCFLCCV